MAVSVPTLLPTFLIADFLFICLVLFWLASRELSYAVQAAITDYPRLSALHNRNLFLTNPGAEKFNKALVQA